MKCQEGHHDLRWKNPGAEGDPTANLRQTRCFCGLELCRSISPDGAYGCNLKSGHTDDCRNTRHPKITWPAKASKAA